MSSIMGPGCLHLAKPSQMEAVSFVSLNLEEL